jgi:hypothetical protein
METSEFDKDSKEEEKVPQNKNGLDIVQFIDKIEYEKMNDNILFYDEEDDTGI